MPEQEKPLEAGSTFGDELRREREIRGISLKEIADSTKVSKRFLEAIERNDHRNLPAPVFTRGFVREYARYVGLSADDMVSRYMHFVDMTAEAASAPQERERPPLQPIAREPYRPQSFGTIGRAAPGRGGWWITALVVALLAGGAFLVINHRLPLLRVLRGRKPAAAAARAGSRRSARSLSPMSQTVKPSSPASSASAQPPLHLLLELTADSWVSLQADGRSVVNGELRDGESRAFDAEKEFRFQTIGNAGGVVLTINGIHVPPLGNQGEVLHDTVYDRAWLSQATAPRRQSQ